jgi:FkbM family methyltransferase
MNNNNYLEHEFHRPDLNLADHLASEIALTRDLSRLLGEGSVVIDVGANRGQFALDLLKIQPNSTIFSFEPLPEAFEDLQRLASVTPQIDARNYAISATSGESKFNVMESDVGSSLLEPVAGQPSRWLTPIKKISVNTIRLDQLLESELAHVGQIDLLKSDTQGTDLEVLLSAGRYLNPDRIKAVLVEINFVSFYKAQKSVHSIFHALDDAGYRLAWLYPHRDHNEWLWWADGLFIKK